MKFTARGHSTIYKVRFSQVAKPTPNAPTRAGCALPYENRSTIREAQSTLPDASGGVFAGRDTDNTSDRYDGCHLSEKGLRRCSELWFKPQRPPAQALAAVGRRGIRTRGGCSHRPTGDKGGGWTGESGERVCVYLCGQNPLWYGP